MPRERWTGPADIAWCEEHGLHGARDRCFECDELVEQIRMVPLEDLQSDETRDVVARAFANLVGADPDLASSIFGERAEGMLKALVAHFSQDFGPREDEDGEGVKPADPSDGAANQGKQRSAPRPADCSGPAPDADKQEGAESSRVGRPSTPSELGRLLPDYGGVKRCASDICKDPPLGEEKGAYLYRDLTTDKLVVFCGDCARFAELNLPERFKLVAL